MCVWVSLGWVGFGVKFGCGVFGGFWVLSFVFDGLGCVICVGWVGNLGLG